MSEPVREADEWAQFPGYGLWPCPNEWHTTHKPLSEPTGSCPDCPNTWWASDGSECPEEYALVARIKALLADRDRLAGEVAESLWRGFKTGWGCSGEGSNAEYPGLTEAEVREMFDEEFPDV